MLSAETAAGRYPVEAVAMMNRIACSGAGRPALFLDARGVADSNTSIPRPMRSAPPPAKSRAWWARAAIVSYTTSGATALRARANDLEAPILVLTFKPQHRAAACLLHHVAKALYVARMHAMLAHKMASRRAC